MKRLILVFGILQCMRPVFSEQIGMKTGSASCIVETVGARVVSFKAKGGEDVLWNADPVQLTDAKWAHGGLPVCWPWFGDGSRADIHGTAWRAPFEIVSRKERKEQSELVLARNEGDLRLEYAIVLRDALELVLKTTNRGTSNIVLSAAFHPYFQIGDRDGVEIEGVGPKALRLTRAMDDAYPVQSGAHAVCRLHDRLLGRTILISFAQATEVNVWNPGGGRNYPGTIPGDEWRRFVCIEPALGEASKAVCLQAGESVSLTMSIGMCR